LGTGVVRRHENPLCVVVLEPSTHAGVRTRSEPGVVAQRHERHVVGELGGQPFERVDARAVVDDDDRERNALSFELRDRF
jgi:hypothetical protein